MKKGGGRRRRQAEGGRRREKEKAKQPCNACSISSTHQPKKENDFQMEK
jgi:hypothetical protein